ncbi:hypothetical protein Vretimale_9291 [Volvox reticuliferus]|uniref:Uncharacterized protein n=1 Tax=Volvox reticuliferus TaxID=1737510 RepID=A0A8J4CG00_9CHLO|nr:hypothetical protein Vretifemale_10156 [Volvox reticuliferus]GIM04792.1 hypothetical protein Vretimale_9291 [Volvox reticuliferus]
MLEVEMWMPHTSSSSTVASIIHITTTTAPATIATTVITSTAVTASSPTAPASASSTTASGTITASTSTSSRHHPFNTACTITSAYPSLHPSPSPPPPPPSAPPPLPPSPRLPRRLLSSLLGYSHHLLHLPLPPSFPMAAARTSFPSPLPPSMHF